MRKFIFLVAISCAALAHAQTCTPGTNMQCTPNLNLFLPDAHYPNWNVPLNQNFQIIDTLSQKWNGGAVGGVNGNLQFNNNGVLGGASGLNYTPTSSTAGALGVTGVINAGGAINAGGTITGGALNTTGTITGGTVIATTPGANGCFMDGTTNCGGNYLRFVGQSGNIFNALDNTDPTSYTFWAAYNGTDETDQELIGTLTFAGSNVTPSQQANSFQITAGSGPMQFYNFNAAGDYYGMKMQLTNSGILEFHNGVSGQNCQGTFGAPVCFGSVTASINTTTGNMTAGALLLSGLAGTGSRCLHVDASGNVTTTGSECGTSTGIAGVASINGGAGAFTFSGSGVNCTGTTCTFTGGASMTYPGAGVPVSTGSAWGTSLSPAAAAQYIRSTGSGAWGVSAIQAADVPTLNQNTTGTAANVTGVVAIAHGGTGTTSPGIVAGSGISVTGSWPTQTVANTGLLTNPFSGCTSDGGGGITCTGNLTAGGSLFVKDAGGGVTWSSVHANELIADDTNQANGGINFSIPSNSSLGYRFFTGGTSAPGSGNSLGTTEIARLDPNGNLTLKGNIFTATPAPVKIAASLTPIAATTPTGGLAAVCSVQIFSSGSCAASGAQCAQNNVSALSVLQAGMAIQLTPPSGSAGGGTNTWMNGAYVYMRGGTTPELWASFCANTNGGTPPPGSTSTPWIIVAY